MEDRTLIVGGGIVGLSAAYFLARRGAAVTLVEKGDGDGGASTGNAGLISLGHAPLPRPGVTLQAARWMFDSTSPLYIRPRLDAALMAWLWRFRQASARRHFQRSMDLLAAHGHVAGELFREMVETEGLDCEYAPIGQLEVFATAAGRRHMEETAAMLRGYGYHVDLLDGDALREREPAFKDHVLGAALYRDSAFANPDAFVRDLRDRIARHGVDVRLGTSVRELIVRDGRCRGVRTTDGAVHEATRVVLAAGIWSTGLARTIGVRAPMQAAKGYHVNVSSPDPPLRTAAILSERFVAVTPMAGGLRLAGTLELSGINHRFLPRRVDRLGAGAAAYLRGMEATEPRCVWCGLRPCTADGLPIVGWAPGVGDLFIATGHAMLGFTLGPLAGRCAAESVLDGRTSVDIEPLSPARYG
jgi:D-amino-acid dehydrogenase